MPPLTITVYTSVLYLCCPFICKSVAKNSPANAGDAGDRSPIFGLGRSPDVANGNPLFLTGKFQGQRILVGYSPWGHKESNMTED